MTARKYLLSLVCVGVLIISACNTISLSLTTATPTPTDTPVPTNTPIPTATPKPLCPKADFEEMERYVEQFDTYVENGESVIESGDILVQALLLGGITSWTESLNELAVSECIQPAKDQLEESYEYMQSAVGTAQTGDVKKAKENFVKALDSFDAYQDCVEEISE
jgi:hypothetical protein